MRSALQPESVSVVLLQLVLVCHQFSQERFACSLVPHTLYRKSRSDSTALAFSMLHCIQDRTSLELNPAFDHCLTQDTALDS